MAEHKHDWKYDSPSYDCERIMCDCGVVLNWAEIETRLNALEGIYHSLKNGIEDNPPMRTEIIFKGEGV